MSRTTYQKQCVLAVLHSMRGQHPTAEAVYAEVLKTIPSISLATVYRILNKSAEGEVVNRIHGPDSAVRYDDWQEPHHHLLCSSCKRLFDLPVLPIQEIVMPVNPVSGHTITGVELIFRGICSECGSEIT